MRVVVLGATGEMGARVVRWLRVLLPEAELVGACRSAGRSGSAGALPLVAADVGDPRSLAPLLDGASVAVNVVGPYRWDPDALIAACVTSRCHYVDLAEDPDFLAAVDDAARRHGAAEAGVGVVAGASTVPGLVDLLARHVVRPDTARIAAWLSMGSRNPVSRGLLVGLLRPLGRRRCDRPEAGRWFQDVDVRPIAGRRLRFAPYPWPEGDLACDGRRLPVELFVGFDRAWITHGLALAGRLLGRLSESRVESLAPLLLPGVAAARPLGTPRGALVVAGFDASGCEGPRVEVHASQRGLDVPALPAAWAVARLLGDGVPAHGEARGRLADRISPPEALRALRDAGYSVLEAGG